MSLTIRVKLSRCWKSDKTPFTSSLPLASNSAHSNSSPCSKESTKRMECDLQLLVQKSLTFPLSPCVISSNKPLQIFIFSLFKSNKIHFMWFQKHTDKENQQTFKRKHLAYYTMGKSCLLYLHCLSPSLCFHIRNFRKSYSRVATGFLLKLSLLLRCQPFSCLFAHH